VKCNYCGSHMRPEDVFCKNCQTITPKVREMLARYPNKMPDEYYPHSGYIGLHCPHCNRLYQSNFRERIGGMHLRSPIQHCKKCQNYFLDNYCNEWSISSRSYKNERRFAPFLLILNEIFIIDLITNLSSISWGIFAGFVYLLIHFPLCLLWYALIINKAKKQSQLRMERNPDYPQILADMGYGPAMDKKYRHLVKYHRPKLTLKEILKDAFTFD